MVIEFAPRPVPAEELPAPPPPPAEETVSVTPKTGPPVPGPVVLGLSVILVLCVTAVFFGAFSYGLSGLQQQRSQRQLYAEFRGLLDPSSPTAPSIGGTIPVGTPVALVNSPQAGIHNAIVVEGTSSGALLAGPGHLRNTPLPGQAGESVLVGKSTTAGAPFGGITKLLKGDVVKVRTGQGLFHFKVEGQFAAGDRLPSIRSTAGLLTLVTSSGRGWLGRLAPNHLVYVVAKLQGKTVTAPKGAPKTVSPAQIQGHNDPSAWPFALMWFVALLAGSAVCWRLWSRWGILQTWLVGMPVLFGILWGFSNEAMRLLPNAY